MLASTAQRGCPSPRARVNLTLLAYRHDMGAHGYGCAIAVATHDGNNHTVMLHVGFRQPSQIAKLCAPERLHPRTRGERHFGKVGIVAAGIDGPMERLVGLVKALRVTDL